MRNASVSGLLSPIIACGTRTRVPGTVYLFHHRLLAVRSVLVQVPDT